MPARRLARIKLRYRFGSTFYDIEVRNHGAEGGAQGEHTIALVDDGQEHRFELQIGLATPSKSRRRRRQLKSNSAGTR